MKSTQIFKGFTTDQLVFAFCSFAWQILLFDHQIKSLPLFENISEKASKCTGKVLEF